MKNAEIMEAATSATARNNQGIEILTALTETHKLEECVNTARIDTWICVRVSINDVLQVTAEYYKTQVWRMPIPEAALSITWVCGRSLAGTAVSNPVGGIEVCLL